MLGYAGRKGGREEGGLGEVVGLIEEVGKGSDGRVKQDWVFSHGRVEIRLSRLYLCQLDRA